MLSGSQTDALLRISVIIIITFLLKNIFGYLQFYLMNYSEESIIRDLRNNLYGHLHSLPLGYFTNERKLYFFYLTNFGQKNVIFR